MSLWHCHHRLHSWIQLGDVGVLLTPSWIVDACCAIADVKRSVHCEPTAVGRHRYCACRLASIGILDPTHRWPGKQPASECVWESLSSLSASPSWRQWSNVCIVGHRPEFRRTQEHRNLHTCRPWRSCMALHRTSSVRLFSQGCRILRSSDVSRSTTMI